MPKLTTLIEHFEATGNRPQTVREIGDALGESEQKVRTMLTHNVSNRHLIRREGKTPNTRYCFLEAYLETHRNPVTVAPDMDTLRLEFCRRWNVLSPYEATRDNPEALRDWLETLDQRTAA